MWNRARRFPAPQHDVVIEPFAGSAGYSTFYKCQNVILIDRDPIICAVWRFLISASEDEIAALPNMPDVGACVDDFPLIQEAKWLIGFWLNRGSSQPKKTRTAFGARHDRAQLLWGENAKRRIVEQLPMIRRWRIIEGGYNEAPDIEATWLIDQPYQDKGRYYRCKFNDFDALAEFSNARRGLVMVCEQEGADWLPFSPLGTFKSTRGTTDEVAFIRGNRNVLL
jgi:hypothetical protein